MFREVFWFYGPLFSIAESAREKLDEAYTILKNKLEIEPERFDTAVFAFHRGVVSKSSDQLVQALEEFGKNCEGKLESWHIYMVNKKSWTKSWKNPDHK